MKLSQGPAVAGLAAILVAVGGPAVGGPAASANSAAAYGIPTRVEPLRCLKMPALAAGAIPKRLSQTGAFSDTARMTPSNGLIPYDLVVAFWSDGAQKSRWVAIPRGKIDYSASGEWKFPACTVFVKNFDLPIDARNPEAKRRLETRLLVRDSQGGVYGVTYQWRPDGSDADLLTAAKTEEIPITAADGSVQRQTWYYPSPKDCLTCHTANAGLVLGVKARQLNRDFKYSSGVIDNELRAWNHIGLFKQALNQQDLGKIPTLAAADDTSRSIEDRARSYLDANCSQCHRPGGTVASFDARFETPLDKQFLVDGPVLIDQAIDKPRVIAPHDIWRSMAHIRVSTNTDIRMPPLARETIDQKGVQLLGEWILSLPGRAVVPPPVVSPAGGSFDKPIEITLTDSEPGADIRYTLDGSVPGISDPRYEKPIKLDATTVLRTRAYKDGFTRSVTEQQVFTFGQ
jgi:uncharacterized repeat protein (TIGR03806 family)